MPQIISVTSSLHVGRQEVPVIIKTVLKNVFNDLNGSRYRSVFSKLPLKNYSNQRENGH